MRKTFTQKLKNAFGSLCRVTFSNAGQVNISSDLDISNIKMLSLPGINTKPKVGDTGVILPLDDGSFIYLGNVKSSGDTVSGHIKFEVESGAYILLKENGDVEINSMIIAPDGTIR